MGKTNLGKVLIAPKGTWDASTAYERLDVVNNNGASWIAKRENTGVTPADGDDWTNLLDITKQGVVDALGYTPAPDYAGRWYTVRNETFAEDTTAFSYDTDANGDPISLNGLIMVLKTSFPQEECSIRVNLRNRDGYALFSKTPRILAQTGQTGYYSTFVLYAIPLYGLFMFRGARGKQGSDMDLIDFSNADQVYTKQEIIREIDVFVYTADIALQAGSRLIIYGIRA